MTPTDPAPAPEPDDGHDPAFGDVDPADAVDADDE